MNANDFFLEAIKAKAQYRRAWVFKAFSLFREAPDAWKKNPIAYDIIHEPSGYFFVKPDLSGLEKIEADPTVALMDAVKRTVLQVPAGYFEYWPEGGETTAGNLLFNSCAIWPTVGGIFGYFNDNVNVGKIEGMFLEMKDTPEDEETRKQEIMKNPGVVFVDQYLKFCDAIGYLQEFTQLFTVALTEKAISPPVGIEEKKKEVLEKYKDSLNDPLTQTKIYEELVAFDSEYLKGDESEKFLLSSKSRETVRRKLFLIMGGEAGLEASNEIKLTTNSLSEGWQKDTIPDNINNARAGTFSRGTETQGGGTTFKWLVKSTSGMNLTVHDCGSTHLLPYKVTNDNKDSIFKLYHVGEDGKPQVILEPKNYVGKYVRLRLPSLCLVQDNNYCSVCAGDKLNANPNALSLAAISYGGGFLRMKLKAMHGKAHKAAIVTLEDVIS